VDLPFIDVADNTTYYRLSNDTYIGQQAWTVKYYNDVSTANAPLIAANVVSTKDFRPPNANELIPIPFDIPGMNGGKQWFSARFERLIFIENPTRLGFELGQHAGGARVYYQQVQPSGGSCATYSPSTNARNTAASANTCLIIDDWRNTPSNTPITRFVNFTPGQYTIVVEYYHTGSTYAPNLNMDIFSPQINPDDVGLNSASVDCNWGQFTQIPYGERNNTRTNSWTAGIGLNDIPSNQRCYLELRGFIQLSPEELTVNGSVRNPYITFWNIWDLNAQTTVRLEVAKYNTTASPRQRPSTPSEWVTVWSRTGSAANYEWRQESVPLLGVSGLTLTNTDAITYRFVIQNNDGGSSAGRRRWYVDDVRVGGQILPDLTNVNPAAVDTFTVCTGNRDTCASNWSMEEPTVVDDFRSTGRWALTNSRPHGVAGGTNMAWEDDPNGAYTVDPDGTRIYWLEFGKRVDLRNTWNTAASSFSSASTSLDVDGDAGPPMLSFWQSYSVKNGVVLAVQYFDETTTPGQWRNLRTIANTTAGGERIRSDIHFTEVLLNQREDSSVSSGFSPFDDWKTRPLRIRFAMTVSPGGTPSTDIGWTIDDIMIERQGAADYLPYPFIDSAGDGTGETVNTSLANWTRTGLWNISNEAAWNGKTYAFTDSPFENYAAPSTSTMELVDAIDLNSDSPDNPTSNTCGLVAVTFTINCAASRSAAANEPTLTFWWQRGLANGHSFTVEMRNQGGAGSPITVWEYTAAGNSGTQPAWERVEIALYPFITNNASSYYEDDIILTFRLNATSGTTGGTGLIIDQVEIQNEAVVLQYGPYRLGGYADGQFYQDIIDDRTGANGPDSGENYDLRWWRGGEWFGVLIEQANFKAHSLRLAMHESPQLSVDPLDAGASFRYRARSYNVLELQRPIDLSELDASIDADPRLQWWSYYDIGSGAIMRAELSYKLDNPPVPANTLTYGDDERYGWSPWETVFFNTNESSNRDPNLQRQNYAWVLNTVNLRNATLYSADNGSSTGTQNYVGKQIRLRFVLDATQTANSTNVRDGWFIDDVQFTAVKRRTFTPTQFNQAANEASTWIFEGNWGVDLERYRATAGTTALSGDSAWTVHYVNCRRRPTVTGGVLTAPATSDLPCNPATDISDIFALAAYRDAYLVPGDLNYATYNASDQWYVRSSIATLPFTVDFGNGRPPGTNWPATSSDDVQFFGAEFQRRIIISQPTTYVFYTRADDGARVGITPFPVAGTNAPVSGATPYSYDIDKDGDIDVVNRNNVINRWTNSGVRVDSATLTLVPKTNGSPETYLINVQYYENTGGALFAFGMGVVGGTSFSDSPMEIPGETNNPIAPLTNISMMLNGFLDLRGTNQPVWTWYGFWDADASQHTTDFYTEVSNDGGFTWSADATLDDGYTGYATNDGRHDAPDSKRHPESGQDWQLVSHSLNAWRASGTVMIRWRLYNNGTPTQVAQSGEDGVNVTDARIFDLSPANPQAAILVNPPLNVAVSLGETQTLEVLATGQSPLLYEWFRLTSGGSVPSSAGTAGTIPAGSERVQYGPTATYVPPVTGTYNINAVGTYTYWVRVSNSVNAVISLPTQLSVRDCVPVSPGDCNIYRINFNGPDLASRDDSQPGWAGTSGGSGTAYLPTGVETPNVADTVVSIDAVNANDLISAAGAVSAPAPEALYETMIKGTNLSWNFTVVPGNYNVRLYMADPTAANRLQSRFDARLNGVLATYIPNGGTTAVQWANKSFYTEASDQDQRGGVVEFSTVTVGSAGTLNISLNGTEATSDIYVSGLEILPQTSAVPQIINQPSNRTAATGENIALSVNFTGLIANVSKVEWFRVPTTPDTSRTNTNESTPVSGGLANHAVNTTYNAVALSGSSTLTISNVSDAYSYWVKITGGTSGTQVLRSDVADLSLCSLDKNVFGSCNRYYIDVGGHDVTGTRVGSSAINWFVECNTATPPVVYTGRATGSLVCGGRNTGAVAQGTPLPGTWGNIDNTFVPASVINDRRGAATNFGWDLTITPGNYTVSVYISDDDLSNSANATARNYHLDIEGIRVLNNFRPAQYYVNTYRAGVNPNAVYAYRMDFPVTVLDTNLDIDVLPLNSSTAEFAAISVVPR
jgi:hypothetical protein